jgi:hypothetical protein
VEYDVSDDPGSRCNDAGREEGEAGSITGQDVLECKLNVAGIESRRLDEGQVILAYPK